MTTLPEVSGFRLPYGLRADYELVTMLPKRGGEAVLLTVRPRGADGPVNVLKLYAREHGLRTDALHLVRRAAVDHVVTLLDFGTEQGVGFELLEYVAAGDLDDFVRREGILDERMARDAVVELTGALECIHGLASVPLAHGDLKPANILVRSTDPLDLVLADFGMATLQHDTRSAALGTPRWSDPFANAGYIQPEGDWWSLGAVAFWLRTGQPLMAQLIEDAALKYLVKHNADLSALPTDDSLDWLRLCQGLLVRDEHERWGVAQVRQWLDGESPEVGSQWADPEPAVAPAPTHPIVFQGRTYDELADLGLGLAQDWDASIRLLENRRSDLLAVLGEHGRQTKDLDLAADAETLVRSPEAADLQLSRLIRRLSPDTPPVYRRWAIDSDSLAGLADEAAGNPDSPAAGAVTGIFDDHVLAAWDLAGIGPGESLDERWHDLVAGWSGSFEEHAGQPEDAVARRARAAILLALLRPAESQDLTRRARDQATRRARNIDWYHGLYRSLGDNPGADYALITLAATATAEADATEEATRAELQRRAAQRAADSLIRVPRTRTILGWCLILQSGFVLLWLGLRILAPRSWLGVTPESALELWADALPDRVANWLTWWTDPLLVLPLFAVSAVLYVRARTDGPEGTTARHPLERRAMQGAIALTCLLVPPLIPVGVLGWWRGLQFYAPDALRSRDALRTISMGSGIAAGALLVGLVVGVGPSPQSLALTAEYQQWAGQGKPLTALAGPVTSVGHLAGGIPAVGWALAVTVATCLAGPALIALASRAYAVASPRVRRGMGSLALPGLLGLACLPLGYLPRTWGIGCAVAAGVWVTWVVLRGRGP